MRRAIAQRCQAHLFPVFVTGSVTNRPKPRAALTSTTLAQHLHRLADAALARLIGLGSGDLEHVPPLVAVREAIEGLTCLRLGVERGSEVVRDAHLARLGVELDLDLDLVAPHHASAGTVLGADADR